MRKRIRDAFETLIVCTVTIFVLIFGILVQDVHAAPLDEVIREDIAAYNGNSAQIYWISDAICYAASSIRLIRCW